MSGKTIETLARYATLAAGLTLAASAGAGHVDFEPESGSSTITTNAYDGTSTSGDPDVSCLDMSMDGGATLRGYCNAVGADGTIDHNATYVGLDSHAGCDEGGALAWGETGISGDATDIAAGVDSTGGVYRITAKCDGVESALEVDGRFRNAEGSLAQD